MEDCTSNPCCRMGSVELPVVVEDPDLWELYATGWYGSDGAACFDLRAAKDGVILPGAGGREPIPTGIRVAVPEGYVLIIRGRSGLAKRGVRVHHGTIDSDYRGEIGVLAYSDSEQSYKMGDRLAQAMLLPIPTVRPRFVGALDDTARGCGGFGSTGV